MIRLASAGFIFAIALAVAASPASAVKCRDEITNHTVLTADLTCKCYYGASDNLIVVGPATLDLNGHTVSCKLKYYSSTCISIRGKGATVKNGIVSGCYSGVGGEFRGALIKDIIAERNGYYGIHVNGNNNKLQNVTAKHTRVVTYDNCNEEFGCLEYVIGTGIFLSGNNNRLLNARATDNANWDIDVDGNNNEVRDSFVARSGEGVLLYGKDNTVISNTVEDSKTDGISIYNGIGNVIRNNTFRRCGGNGVNIEEGSNSIVADNKLYSTGSASIYVSGRNSNIRLTGNRITKSSGDGIVLDYATNAVVASNVIVNSAGNGIVLGPSAARCRVKNNTVRKCGMVGLRIRGADGSNFTNNMISFCKTGISAGVGSNRNRLINNRASNNTLFDLSDLSANCGSNVWKGNTGKGNIACTQEK